MVFSQLYKSANVFRPQVLKNMAGDTIREIAAGEVRIVGSMDCQHEATQSTFTTTWRLYIVDSYQCSNFGPWVWTPWNVVDLGCFGVSIRSRSCPWRCRTGSHWAFGLTRGTCAPLHLGSTDWKYRFDISDLIWQLIHLFFFLRLRIEPQGSLVCGRT